MSPRQSASPASWYMPTFSSFTMCALAAVTAESSSMTQPRSRPIMSTAMVLFTSAAVVITACAPRRPAMDSVSSLAPPMCPDSTLMAKLDDSSTTTTAGSVFLLFMCGATSLIVAPSENMQTSPSYLANSSAILADVASAYHRMPSLSVCAPANFSGAYRDHPGLASSSLRPVDMPCFVMASMATDCMCIRSGAFYKIPCPRG